MKAESSANAINGLNYEWCGEQGVFKGCVEPYSTKLIWYGKKSNV